MTRKSDVHLSSSVTFSSKWVKPLNLQASKAVDSWPMSPYLPCCKMLVQLQQRRWTWSKLMQCTCCELYDVCMTKPGTAETCQILLLRSLRAAEKSRGSKLTLLPPRKIMKNLFHLVHLYVILSDLRVCFRNFPTQIFASSTHIYHSLPWSLPWSLTLFAWKRCRVWSRAGDLQWKYLHAEDDKRPIHHGCSTKTRSINIYNMCCILYLNIYICNIFYVYRNSRTSFARGAFMTARNSTRITLWFSWWVKQVISNQRTNVC